MIRKEKVIYLNNKCLRKEGRMKIVINQ